MKKYFLYVLVLFAFIYTGCDKPGLTELVDDETFDVEILGKDLDNEYYSNGFDTSGVTENNTNYASIVSVSGIMLTKNGTTNSISFAQAILFDLSEPIYSPQGFLLGYKTITPGIIRFDNVRARTTNCRVRYRESGVLIDTVLGEKYELFNRPGRFGNDPFIYPYNSSINFSFNPFLGGQQSNFEIPTPKEVTGNVKLIAANENNKFRADLLISVFLFMCYIK